MENRGMCTAFECFDWPRSLCRGIKRRTVFGWWKLYLYRWDGDILFIDAPTVVLEDGNKQCFFTSITELRSVVSCVCCIAVSVQSRSVNLKCSLVAVVVVVPHPADTSHNPLSPCSLFYPRSSRFLFATSSTRESIPAQANCLEKYREE